MNKKEITFFFLFTIGIIILLKNTVLDKMWAFGDLVAFPTDLKLTSEWIYYSWRGEGLGSPNFPASNYYLTMLFSSVLLKSFLAQKLLFISTFIFSFCTFYYLLKSLNFKLESSFLGALLYSFNPVTISSFLTGGIGELMTFAALPLFILYLFRLISEKKFNLKYLAILVLSSLFIWNIYVAFWYGLIIMPGVLLIGSRSSAKKFLRLVPVLLILLMVFLPVIIPISTMVGGVSKEKISFESNAKYTYGDVSLPNIIRLTGNKGSAQAKEFLNYNVLNNYTIFGCILSLFAISSLLFVNSVKNGKNMKKLLIFSVSISFLISIGLLLLIRNYPWIVDLNPIFSSLRNPVKLMYPLVFSFAILFSIMLEVVLNKLNLDPSEKSPNFSLWDKSPRELIPKRRQAFSFPGGKMHHLWHRRGTKKGVLKKIIIATMILVILLYNYPALDGTLGLEKVRGDQYFIHNKYYQLPKIFETIEIKHKENRILFLPWEYPTNLRVRSELPNYFGTPLGAQILSVNISSIKTVFDSIVQDSTNKHEVLSLFNVKYVVVDKTFKSYYENLEWYKKLINNYKAITQYSHDSHWLIGDPTYFYTLFNKDSNFKSIYEDGNFAIFENVVNVEKFFKLSLNEERNFTISYVKLSENLLKNPSFENGMNEWRMWPGRLVNISKESKNGEYSVKIYGEEKWFTILYQVVAVKENTLYKLQFSVKGYNMTDLHVKVLWYNQTEKVGEGDAFKSDYIKLYEKNLTEGTWHDINETFLSPTNAKSARIQFLGSRSKNYSNTLTIIDNVSFYRIVSKVIGLATNSNTVRNYKRVNPTLYEVRDNTTKPFILIFAESYDPSWRARVYQGGKLVEEVEPISFYGAINGFLIKQTGEYKVIIKYKPQDWFEIGLFISIATFIGCAGYLFYDWKKDDKRIRMIKRKIYTILKKKK